MQEPPNISTAKEKAKRLFLLRRLAKVDRYNFAEMAMVSIFTYRGWENARFGGIPLKRAKLIAEGLKTEGIECSAEWIIDGVGEPPKKIMQYQLSQFKEALANTSHAQTPAEIEDLRIKAELEFFRNNNGWNILSYLVDDDSMEPYFLSGDLVAGKKLSVEEFEDAIGLRCIVRTKSNKILLRQLQKSNSENLFNLLCLNPNSKQQIITQDVELIDIAPVIWIRRDLNSQIKNSHKR